MSFPPWFAASGPIQPRCRRSSRPLASSGKRPPAGCSWHCGWCSGRRVRGCTTSSPCWRRASPGQPSRLAISAGSGRSSSTNWVRQPPPLSRRRPSTPAPEPGLPLTPLPLLCHAASSGSALRSQTPGADLPRAPADPSTDGRAGSLQVTTKTICSGTPHEAQRSRVGQTGKNRCQSTS